MTDNAKKFLAAVSQDEALKKEFEGVKGLEAMLKIAKAHGFELTAEDFTPSDMEKLSEDEMKAVAGGRMMAASGSGVCQCCNVGEGSGLNFKCSCNRCGEGLHSNPALGINQILHMCTNCTLDGFGYAMGAPEP